MLARFYDAENGGFWQSAAGAKDLILRVKEDYDGAEPSGNSVAILALLRLGGSPTARNSRRPPRRPCACSPTGCSRSPRPCPTCCRRWISRSKNPGARWSPAIPGSPEARALLRAVHSVYQPNKVVLGNTGAVEPFARTLPARDGPVVYLCTGTACQPPTQRPGETSRSC